MWIILVSLVIGIILGILNILPRKLVSYNSRFQQGGVILLIFSMGASIGSNRDIISGLEGMGLKALVFAVLTSMISILFVYIISRRFLEGKNTK